jgi:Mg2+-importing ATPase
MIKEAPPQEKYILFKKKETSKRLSEASVARIRNAAKGDRDFCFSMLQSSASGLSNEEVEKRQKINGFNVIAREKVPAWYLQFLGAFLNPFTGILIVIASISFTTEVLTNAPGERNYNTVIVISVLILIGSLLHFWQEF